MFATPPKIIALTIAPVIKATETKATSKVENGLTSLPVVSKQAA